MHLSDVWNLILTAPIQKYQQLFMVLLRNLNRNEESEPELFMILFVCMLFC